MKKKIITITLSIAALISAFLLGTTQSKTVINEVETIPAGYINTNSDDFYNNYIDMRQVIDYIATENGLHLYMSDGSGYWYEK